MIKRLGVIQSHKYHPIKYISLFEYRIKFSPLHSNDLNNSYKFRAILEFAGIFQQRNTIIKREIHDVSGFFSHSIHISKVPDATGAERRASRTQ